VRIGGEISVFCRERAGDLGQRKTSTILQDSPPTSEALDRRPARFVLRPAALRQQYAGANGFLRASAENYYKLVGTSGEFRFDIPALLSGTARSRCIPGTRSRARDLLASAVAFTPDTNARRCND